MIPFRDSWQDTLTEYAEHILFFFKYVIQISSQIPKFKK